LLSTKNIIFEIELYTIYKEQLKFIKMKTMNLKKLSVIVFFIALCFNSYSQTGVTSYSIYSLGVNTSITKNISGELKVFANRPSENLLLEADVFYNFEPNTYHKFSVGLGLNVGPFFGFDHINAFTIPAQLEIYPLQDFKKISLIFELTLEFIIEDVPRLRNLLGIRYTFGELKK